jgi:hypothetical protein
VTSAEDDGSYELIGALEGSGFDKRSDSDDEDQCYITREDMERPPTKGQRTSKNIKLSQHFSCWHWAVANPITRRLDDDAFGFGRTYNNVKALLDVTKQFVEDHGFNCEECNAENIDEAISNIENIPGACVIAMRLKGQGNGEQEFHYARYQFGQWTHKPGDGSLMLIKSKENTAETLKTAWLAHVRYVGNLRLKFPRRDGAISTEEIKYGTDTLYLVVTPRSKKS